MSVSLICYIEVQDKDGKWHGVMETPTLVDGVYGDYEKELSHVWADFMADDVDFIGGCMVNIPEDASPEIQKLYDEDNDREGRYFYCTKNEYYDYTEESYLDEVIEFKQVISTLSNIAFNHQYQNKDDNVRLIFKIY